MSEMTEAAVVADNPESVSIDPDPMRTIIEAEARAHHESFSRLRQQAGEEEEEDTPAASEKKQGATEKAQDSTTKRPGVDKVLKEVEEKIGKGAADVIRSMQTERQNRRRESESMRQEIEELKTLVLRQTAPAQANAPEEDPLAGLTPQQWKIFNEMAKRAGLVSKPELAEKDSSQFVRTEIEAALEKYGEGFGFIDETTGEFIPSEDSEKEMGQVYERIYDPGRGLTAKDLFVLARHDQIVEDLKRQIEETQKGAQREKRADRVDALRRATTEKSSASSVPTRRASIYQKGENLDTVIARAVAEQLR